MANWAQALADTAPTGLVALDRDGIVRYANPAARRRLGGDAVGQPFARCLPARFGPTERAELLDLLRGAGSAEVPCVGPDGLERRLSVRTSEFHTTPSEGEFHTTPSEGEFHTTPSEGEFHTTPSEGEFHLKGAPPPGPPEFHTTPSEGGMQGGYVLVLADDGDEHLQEELRTRTRDLVRANEQLEAEVGERRRAQDAATEASRAKSRFLANMSHELRTPLNAIIGYSELLLEEQPTEELERIQQAARQLLRLVNDVLDLSKVESGRMELAIEPTDLRGLLTEVVELGQTLVQRNGNRLVLHLPGVVPPVKTDPTRVRQVVLNLLANAAKFTKDGVVTVALAFEAGDLGSVGRPPWVEIAVADTGIGIPADRLPHLFKPFVQGDPSTTRDFGGTGLGLALCREFAKLLGGSIEVASEVGRGSRFTLRIPYRKASGLIRTPSPAPLQRRGECVLVVDDDPDAVDLVSRTLAPLGYEVRHAPNGDLGMALAADLRPCVILLDVRMPGRDGWSVLASLKGDGQLSRIPVVLYTMIDDRELALGLGANDVLVKPVSRARLVETITRVTHHKTGTVLVCEDDAATRELIRRTLALAAWKVEQATDGEEALAWLADHEPDVVLLDLMMPKVDGFEIAQRMQSDPRLAKVPIIVLTAMDLTGDDLARLRGSVATVLLKGAFEGDALLREVRAALDRWAPMTYTPPA